MSDTDTRSVAEIIVPDELADRVRREGACARWAGSHNSKGYGNFYDRSARSNRGVHRVAWELVNGPIPDGLEVHHECHVRDCVNVAHLALLTPEENKADQHQPTKRPWRLITHCAKGHEMTPENTIVTPGQRKCRMCRRETVRQNNWKRRGVPAAVRAVAEAER